jgi:hypothetical protein
MANPNPTPPPAKYRFKPGQSGNPLGRSIARSQLDNDFIEALLADFRAHGAAAIQHCRERNPASYLSVIVKTLPREFSVEVSKSNDESSLEAVDSIVARFRALQAERDEAVGRLERLQGSQVGDPNEVQVVHIHKCGG